MGNFSRNILSFCSEKFAANNAGTAYINTGYTPKTTTKLILKEIVKTQNRWAVSGIGGVSPGAFYVGISNSNKFAYASFGGDADTGVSAIDYYGKVATYTLDIPNNKLLINVDNILVYSKVLTIGTPTTNRTFFLFGYSTTGIYNGTIISAEFYENDILVHNFIVKEINGDVVFYDTITNEIKAPINGVLSRVNL